MAFARSFTGAFLGRIVGTIFVVACTYLGFGPLEAVVFLTADTVAPWIARGAFIALGASVFGLMIWSAWKSRLSRTWSERDQLELSAIANLSVGKSISEPYDV